jgi:hypothetical protein
VKEYDLFIPLRYNDGSLIEAAKFQKLHDLLLGRFAGLTYFPQPNEGFWRFGGVTFRDEIVIYRVISAEIEASHQFLTKLKERLKQDLQQEEILIIEREVGLL